MEAKSLVVIVSLAVLISVHSSDGINCWVCASNVTPNCGADFTSTGMTSTLCTGDVSCLIVTINDVITRSCGVTKMAEGCSSISALGVTTETCYCNTDECTTASPGNIPCTLSLLTVGFGVVMKLVF